MALVRRWHFREDALTRCLPGNFSEPSPRRLAMIATFDEMRKSPTSNPAAIVASLDGVSKMGAGNRVEAARIARTKGWL